MITIESRLKSPRNVPWRASDADHLEAVAVDQDVFVERASPGEKGVGHVVADDANFRAAARFDVVKEAAFGAFDGGDAGCNPTSSRE